MFPGVSVDMLKVFVRLLYGEQVTVTQELVEKVGDIARMVGISHERMVSNNNHNYNVTQGGTRSAADNVTHNLMVSNSHLPESCPNEIWDKILSNLDPASLRNMTLV